MNEVEPFNTGFRDPPCSEERDNGPTDAKSSAFHGAIRVVDTPWKGLYKLDRSNI